MAKLEATIDARKLMRNITVTLHYRATHARIMRFRMWLATLMWRIGSRVAGCEFVVDISQNVYRKST